MTFHLWSGESASELRESLQLWLESMQARGLSPKTLRNYRDTVGRFLNFLESLNLRTLDAVQPHHIRKWLLHRQAHGVSNYELHNAHRQPRTFWNWCMREGLTENNPFAKVEKPRLMPTAKPALSPEEVQALLNACEGKNWRRMRDKALILLLLDTGLRIHEAHALTVGDAKQERLLIRGKGGKQRLVFLSPEVRLALRKYLNACPYPLNDDSPLWWGTYGALTLWGMLEVIQKIGKRAGLPKHLGAHAFRRTFATWSLRSGIDLETLRQLMGHSDYVVNPILQKRRQRMLWQPLRQHTPHLLRERRN